MKLSILIESLKQHYSNSRVRGIHFHFELLGWHRMGENRCRDKQLLKGRKTFVCLGGPGKCNGSGGEAGERGCRF